MKSPHALIDGYLEGALTDEQFAELVDWLHADPENAQAFAVWTQMHQQITEQYRRQDAMILMSDETVQPDLPADGDTDDLQSAWADSPPGSATAWEQLLSGSVPDKKNNADESSSFPRRRELVSLTGYVLGQALTSKFAFKAYGVAAALALAVTLFFVFSGGNEDATGPVAGQDPENGAEDSTPPAPFDTPPAMVVANLTAERDAVWGRRPGKGLRAGQRLMLMQGFAEVTTLRGAVAIVQAPATIELLDNANAIRLHSGKLVGICETDSSKGFLVRTPHMDITDLGTRFGVDADADDTEVHVFEGEVEVRSAKNTSGGAARLLAGQAVRSEPATESLALIEQDAGHFLALTDLAGAILPPGASDAGIAALEGQVAWDEGSAYLDSEVEEWTRQNNVVVFEELAAFELTKRTPISLDGPGSNVIDGVPQPATSIPAGIKVRSYVMVLYPETKDHYIGSVTFEGEVIGIATETYQASALAEQTTELARIAKHGMWIEPQQNDLVTLHNDRRTVSFNWLTGRTSSTDAVRVFVRVPDGTEANTD